MPNWKACQHRYILPADFVQVDAHGQRVYACRTCGELVTEPIFREESIDQWEAVANRDADRNQLENSISYSFNIPAFSADYSDAWNEVLKDLPKGMSNLMRALDSIPDNTDEGEPLLQIWQLHIVPADANSTITRAYTGCFSTEDKAVAMAQHMADKFALEDGKAATPLDWDIHSDNGGSWRHVECGGMRFDIFEEDVL